MTAETYDTTETLKRLIAEDRISDDALQAITGIQPAKLRALLGGEPRPAGLAVGPQALTNDQTTRLSTLAAQLDEGLQINDDDRLRAILESLTVECHLTLRNISQLTGIAPDQLELALRDPDAVPLQTKYEIAMKGSYLITAVNRARGE